MKQLKQSISLQKNSADNKSNVETAEQIFFDGVDSINFGAANCKLHFHQIVGKNEDTNTDIRKVILVGVIPTAVLAEICRNVLTNFDENAARLKEGLASQERKIFKKLITDSSKNQ